ncbi:MAG: hypothetical protein N3E47_00920 [Candidatus Bathyarchaeota archaeon]|nr:hypothetical protein [Candidatus Bathyarchaeota archaeon]
MLLDEYQKGWALRYLREAMDEIKMAKRDRRALSLAVDALRKAQAAVYYSLGEPFFIEKIVEETVESETQPENPIIRCLVSLEKSIKRLEHILETYGDTAILEETDRIVSLASKIVNLLTSLED